VINHAASKYSSKGIRVVSAPPPQSTGVMIEPEYPNIRYFIDGGNYIINGYSVLVIGGAYSVDKYYRLARAGYSAERALEADPKETGWFPSECLTQEEMNTITEKNKGKHFDFVLSHTCPLSWEPNDLFLNFIDQSTVDKSMEQWMDELKDNIDWNIWLFGHFHADRIERPHVEQMYMNYENLDTIWNRWNGNHNCKDDWWLPKSPYMRMLDQEK
jgi:3-oxoacid CoA-transferase subunit A